MSLCVAGLLLAYGCGGSVPPSQQSPARLQERTALGVSEPAQEISEETAEVGLVDRPVLRVGTAEPEDRAGTPLIQTFRPEPILAETFVFDPELLKSFEALLTPLDSFEKWEAANQKLLKFGDPAVPLLAQKLREGNDVERELAASTLVLVGPAAKAAIPALRKGLTDEIPFVRANSAVALVQFPEESAVAIPVLVALLEHEDSNLQQLAAMNLSVLGEEASPHVAQLTKILKLKSDDREVVIPVVQLLGRIGPAAGSAIPQLKQIAFEQKGEVSDAATSAIQLIQTTVE